MPLPNVSMQAIAVLNPSSEPVEAVLFLDQSGDYRYARYTSNTSMHFTFTSTRFETVTTKGSISTVPIVWESELFNEYRELGEALAELKELDEDDEWKIEAPVYDAARSVAFGLMINWFPAPKILHHGPDSVVFNWTSKTDNLYLTISSDRMSALISSPERIKRRIEFPAQMFQNPVPVIRYLQSVYLEQPINWTANPAPNLVESAG
jgi:hypothetical protein